MYNISRSKTGSVLLKCKLCSHSERVNEFDASQESRRTLAVEAMGNHTRGKHGREPIGSPAVEVPRVVGLTGDYDNPVGDAGNAFYLAVVLDGWVRIDNYVEATVW
jgi:hypothetical protein